MAALVDRVREFLDARREARLLRHELEELRHQVDQMDDIVEQIIEWGNECAACAAHYKETSVRLKKRCDDLEAKCNG